MSNNYDSLLDLDSLPTTDYNVGTTSSVPDIAFAAPALQQQVLSLDIFAHGVPEEISNTDLLNAFGPMDRVVKKEPTLGRLLFDGLATPSPGLVNLMMGIDGQLHPAQNMNVVQNSHTSPVVPRPLSPSPPPAARQPTARPRRASTQQRHPRFVHSPSPSPPPPPRSTAGKKNQNGGFFWLWVKASCWIAKRPSGRAAKAQVDAVEPARHCGAPALSGGAAPVGPRHLQGCTASSPSQALQAAIIQIACSATKGTVLRLRRQRPTSAYWPYGTAGREGGQPRGRERSAAQATRELRLIANRRTTCVIESPDNHIFDHLFLLLQLFFYPQKKQKTKKL